MIRIAICLVLVTTITHSALARPLTGSVVSATFNLQKAFQGRKVVVNADVYYFLDRKEVLTHFTYPDDFIQVSNILGETKLYFPKTNEVRLQQNPLFSANTDVLFLFFTQNMSELGLKNLGFTLKSTRFDGNLMITRWVAPAKSENVAEVELVFEDYVPIYMSSFAGNGTIINKTYYSNYQNLNGNFVPLRVTEITYANNDSIVSRKDYNNLKFDQQVRSDYINFKIPPNARIIK